MKKSVVILLSVILMLLLSLFPAKAANNSEQEGSLEIISNSQKENLYNSLSEEAKKSLSNLGIDSVDSAISGDIDLNKMMSEIISAVGDNSSSPLKALLSILAVMLLCSMLTGLKSSLNDGKIQQVLDVVTTLCITSALVVPITDTVINTTNVIVTASNFMLAYIPIMLVVMVSAGQAVSGSAYYSMMVMAGQAVAQISSKVIAPMLNAFLGISIAASISPNVNLSGITSLIGKLIKWLLGFIMTLFTALLSFKQLITTSLDNVSTRAVRFTLTSLVPVVGSALSDAYKTIQSSVSLIKSGLGVFVIISLGVVFLPVIAECFLWIVSIGISKAAGEVLNLSQPCKVLEAVSTVVTTLMAIILCILAVFVISTAIVLMMGGAK